MKVNLFIFFSIVIVLAIFFAIQSRNGEGNKSVSKDVNEIGVTTFNEKIENINNKVVDLTSPSDLFLISEFLLIYENPKNYYKNALLFLSSLEKTEQQKLIVVYSMQNLNFDQYKDFIISSVELFIQGNIHEIVLRKIISSGFNKNYYILKNYQDPELISALNRIKKSGKISDDYKRYIDEILSGVAWEKVKNFYDKSEY